MATAPPPGDVQNPAYRPTHRHYLVRTGVGGCDLRFRVPSVPITSQPIRLEPVVLADVAELLGIPVATLAN